MLLGSKRKNKKAFKGESHMEKQEQNKQAETNQQFQGFFANPQVYLNTERGVLTHRLSNDMKIDMPINLYKKILGLPFEKKEQTESSDEISRRNVFGLVARPVIYLSKDKNYLIHSVLGVRVSKHVNYYKRILTSETNLEIQTKNEKKSA